MAKLNERIAAMEAEFLPVAEDQDDMLELYTLVTTVMVAKLERSEDRQARLMIEQGFLETVARRFAGMSFNQARNEVWAYLPEHNCPAEEIKDALKRLRASILVGYSL